MRVRLHNGASLAEKLAARTVRDPESGCLIWQGAKNKAGYGIVTRPNYGKQVAAHRAAYEVAYGPIPEGMTIDHICHTRDPHCPGGADCWHRLCCNPEHLEAVSIRENVLRVWGRTMTPAAREAAVCRTWARLARASLEKYEAPLPDGYLLAIEEAERYYAQYLDENARKYRALRDAA